MFKKHSLRLAILIFTIGPFISACTGAPPALPVATVALPTIPLPTTSIPPTETLVPPTLTPLPPTSTLLPPTATPTEEPIELNPSPRGYISMAYDSESKQVILFGGQTGDFQDPANYSSETWAYDVTTQTWTDMKPAEAPSAKAAAELAYDAESDRVILFGGGRGLSSSRDTWAYDYNTNTWSKMKAQGPAKHLGPRMAYDAESDRIILFGGYDYDAYKMFQDTWAYDYNTDTWSEMKPDASPPGQNFHAMTYDSKADRVILWGGDTTTPDPTHPPMNGSVWAYDFNTNTWQEKKNSTGPGARAYHAIAYGENSDQVFLYGGYDTGTQEMWVYNYNTNAWIRLAEPSAFPGALSRFAMAYIPDTDQFIVFGGQVGSRHFRYTDQTWVYDFNTNTWTDLTRIP